MHPRYLSAPLALLAGSCATAPLTPSQRLVADQPVVPAAQVMVVPSAARAYAAWMLPPDDPWARYHKLTLLSALAETDVVAEMPDVRALPLSRRAAAVAAQLGAAGLPNDTLWIVDLRGAASVAFGHALSHAASTSLVLTFNNWPADNELVPAEETLAALVQHQPRQPAWSPDSVGSAPVFLLDAWRLAYRDQAPPEDVVDNRYFLGAADLPDAETLAARGVRRVVYLVEAGGDQTVEEDDLHEAFTHYAERGIAISLVGLDELEAQRAQGWVGVRLLSRCWHRRLLIHPRATVVRDPRFYARARGGFGGVHASPGLGRGGSGIG